MILGGKFSGQIKWGYGEVKQARQRTKGAGRDMTRLRETRDVLDIQYDSLFC